MLPNVSTHPILLTLYKGSSPSTWPCDKKASLSTAAIHRIVIIMVERCAWENCSSDIDTLYHIRFGRVPPNLRCVESEERSYRETNVSPCIVLKEGAYPEPGLRYRMKDTQCAAVFFGVRDELLFDEVLLAAGQE